MHKLRDPLGESEEDLRRRLGELTRNGKVYVLGLGNTDRADDGAGILVAEALKKRFPLFSFSEHDGVEGTVLDISERNEDATIIFVDAGNIGRDPGAIALIPKERIKETEITTHRVAVALMAAILDKAGKRSVVLCIQPQRIEFQGEVTAKVKASAKTVTNILTELLASKGQ
jgi:hydrogenase maturation protease